MKIGIIGAGHIGGTLTRRLAALGHEVSVANSRGPETLKDLEKETGAHAASVQDVVRDKDVIIVAIPEKSVRDLPRGLFASVPDDTVVIETGNYYPERDGSIPEIEAGMPESVWVQQQLGRPVIKAFNTIYFYNLRDKGRASGQGRLALPVAGDDRRAKEIVLRLIDELGFDCVDAGPLSESWRQQPGTPVYTRELDAAGVRQKLDEAAAEQGQGAPA